MFHNEQGTGGTGPYGAAARPANQGGGGGRVEGNPLARGSSAAPVLQLRTERVAERGLEESVGNGFAVLMVRGERLTLGGSPIATEQSMPADSTMLFLDESCAALWAAISAWRDLAEGKTPRSYRVRPIRYQGATSVYTLRVIEGPLLCDLVNAIEAKQFLVPARGVERAKGSVLAQPFQEAAPLRGWR